MKYKSAVKPVELGVSNKNFDKLGDKYTVPAFPFPEKE
jgi:hypothetical protein